MKFPIGRRTQNVAAVTPRAESSDAMARQKWLLAVCCVAQFMVILDLSIVNVALPSIQLSLGFSAIDLQWVVDAYSIVFAGFLMLGGRFSDRFGQRRTLVLALLGFSAASLLGGVTPDQTVLIIARALQGLSGALMAAGSLAAITSSFPQGPSRHRAIGLWGAMNGAGGAAGALFGGIITQEIGWRWVLLINPPIGIAAAAIAFAVVVDRPNTENRVRFDFAGAIALTGGLIVLVFGIVNAGYLGIGDAASIGPIILGVVLLGLFPVIELRFAKAPLVPMRILTGQLRASNAIVLLFSASIFPMWYVSSLYLQQVLGLSPLKAGLVFLPLALVIMLSARRAGKLVSLVGARAALAAGLALMTGGMLLFARIGSSGSAIGYIVLPGLLMGLGIGLSVVPSTIAATQGAKPEQAGLASGLVNTSRQVGGAIGIAILISVSTQYTSHLIGQSKGTPEALTDGFRLAYFIGAGLCALAFLVTVTMLHRPENAPASGRLKFRVPAGVLAVLVAFAAVDFGVAGGAAAPIGTYTTNGAYSFVSAPGLHPPKVTADIKTVTSQLTPGYIMVDNFYDIAAGPMVGQGGPLILDNALQPVWFKPTPTDVVSSNLSVQTYNGKPVLSWWQGVVTSTGATESGEDVVVNQHYQTVATLHGTDGWILTLHEIKIVGDDAWVTANKNIQMNLTKYGGAKDGTLTDSAVQEYNLKTGKLVYSWDALKHIPLSDSHALAPTNGFPWDAYHVNAIDVESDGTFLTSMRDMWAAYLVNEKTSNIVWTLGGKNSTFTIAANAHFEWQHDVALTGTSEVTLFDDDCCEITGSDTYLAPAGPSRGLVLQLNLTKHTASLVRQYTHGTNFDAAYMGNVQTLTGGNVFVGWGAQPYFSEYSKSGQLLLDGVFPNPDQSYRATLGQWVGLPTTSPSAVVKKTSGKTTVYASWNGATKVASWRVLGGSSASSLSTVTNHAKSGFETAIAVNTDDQIYEVQALDSNGKVIGTSKQLSQ